MTVLTARIFGSLSTLEAIELVVVLLERQNGATVTELTDLTGLAQPKVTRTLQTLARAGVVSRSQTSKAYAVTATEETRRFLDQAIDLALTTEERRVSETRAL